MMRTTHAISLTAAVLLGPTIAVAGPPMICHPVDADHALDVVLAEARPRDALTLWHLLARVTDTRRLDLIGRLVELVGLPPGVTVDGVMDLDASMLAAWWADIELDW